MTLLYASWYAFSSSSEQPSLVHDLPIMFSALSTKRPSIWRNAAVGRWFLQNSITSPFSRLALTPSYGMARTFAGLVLAAKGSLLAWAATAAAASLGMLYCGVPSLPIDLAGGAWACEGASSSHAFTMTLKLIAVYALNLSSGCTSWRRFSP
jgi:hypothetical protein